MGNIEFRKLLEARVEEGPKQLDLFPEQANLVPSQNEYEKEINSLYDEWYQLRARLGDLETQRELFDEVLIPIARGVVDSRARQANQRELQTTSLVPHNVSFLESRGKERFAETTQALERRIEEIRQRIGEVVQTYISTAQFNVTVDLGMNEEHHDSNYILFPDLGGMEKMVLFYLMTGAMPILDLIPDYDDAYDIMNNHLRRSMPKLMEVSDVPRYADTYIKNEDNLELNLSLLSRYFPDEFLGLHPLQSIGVPICDEHQEGEKHHVRFHIILKGRGSKHESRVFSYIQPQSIREKTFKLPFMVWYRGYGINAVGPPEDRLSRERIVRVTTYLEATFGSQGLAERLKLRVHAFRE